MNKNFEYDLMGSKINFDLGDYDGRENSEPYGDIMGGEFYLEWDSEYVDYDAGDYDTPPSGGYYSVYNVMLVSPDFVIEPKGEWLERITYTLESKLNEQ